MSPSEIGFLALGLCVGLAAGVLLVAVMRPRSPLRPVVRVTVTPNAMAPRERVATGPGRPARSADPVPGSPDDDALGDWAAVLATGPGNAPGSGTGGSPSRTLVPSPGGRSVAVPIVVAGQVPGNGSAAIGSAAATAETAVALAERPPSASRAMPPVTPHPTRVDIRPGHAAVTEFAVRVRPPVLEPRPALAADLLAIPILARGGPAGGAAKAGANGAENAAKSSGTRGRPSRHPVEACADERGAAASACAEADRAREASRAVADRLRDARRSLADLQARVEEAGTIADPRHLAAEKERLHAVFQTAHGEAHSTDEAEAAARDWLTSVSEANAAARDAARRIQAGTEELRAQAAALERLDLEANAARVAAERAEDGCRAARESLAACEERQRPTPVPDDEPAERDTSWPLGPEPAYERRPPTPSEPPALPAILRILAGDTAAREQLVAGLGGDDAGALAAWHVRIAKFIDALTARAIEDGYLEVAADHPFWRLFSEDEQREIVQALSALGFRFDGMRGFVDDRVPSARDLSLAVGYAGLDRMRIRTWPGESALGALFDGATVRADLWLASQADDLSLGRVEAALGARAAGLGEVWDAWGRVRPAMLEER